MAGSSPDYDNVRLGGTGGSGGGLRIPQEALKATLSIKKLVSINVGGAGSTNTVTLTPDQVLASELILTNGGSGATTVVFPTPPAQGHTFVAYNNTAAGQICTFKVSGQTGIAVADTKRALLTIEAADIARVTADT